MSVLATTSSSGRPPHHWVVSRPKKLIFVLFLLARVRARVLKIDKFSKMGERQGIAQKRLLTRPEKTAARHGESAAKTSVRTPGISADQREHPFV